MTLNDAGGGDAAGDGNFGGDEKRKRERPQGRCSSLSHQHQKNINELDGQKGECRGESVEGRVSRGEGSVEKILS